MSEMPQSGVTDRKTRKVRQDYCHCLCCLITCSFLHFRPFDGIGVAKGCHFQVVSSCGGSVVLLWVIFANLRVYVFLDGFRIQKHRRLIALINPEWI